MKYIIIGMHSSGKQEVAEQFKNLSAGAIDISFESANGRLQVFDKGTPIVFDEDLAKKILGEEEVTIYVDMHEGSEEATAWGCDLTYDYVKINADYRS